VCLWFFDRDKASADERDRHGETLFIDARGLGRKISRTQIELTDDEVERIAACYHAWRGSVPDTDYADVAGFCRSGTLTEIETAGYALSPGRFVGVADSEEDEIAFEERMATLVDRLAHEMAENDRLAGQVRTALGSIGYDV
jgi:type I restriction enzyme M protein